MARKNQLDNTPSSLLNNNVEVVIEDARTGRDFTPIDPHDQDSVKRECMESLVWMLQANKGDIRALSVIRELLDRVDGKAIQRIESKNLNINHSTPKELTTEDILAALSRAGSGMLEGAGVKLIDGRVERVDDE